MIYTYFLNFLHSGFGKTQWPIFSFQKVSSPPSFLLCWKLALRQRDVLIVRQPPLPPPQSSSSGPINDGLVNFYPIQVRKEGYLSFFLCPFPPSPPLLSSFSLLAQGQENVALPFFVKPNLKQEFCSISWDRALTARGSPLFSAHRNIPAIPPFSSYRRVL